MTTTEQTRSPGSHTGGPAAGGQGPDWRERLRTSRAGTLGVLLVTTLLVMVGAWFIQKPDAAKQGDVTAVQLQGEQAGPPPAVGAPAQDFTARTIDGRTVKLSDYAGKPVWLLFGATWCASCRAEVADVESVYQQAKAQGVEVISLYLSEDAKTVQDYTKATGLTYLHVPDPQTTVASAYRVMGVPAHFYVDRQGKIASIQVGALDRATMEKNLAAITG
ncbi:TlpA family protein disulfide reductase [Mobilicoccus massiliensis]|uniref:TlpA family protein disulfide reductase n=1 Tax=Mobilicoccus massiliensis TaxID=1522310 RepID=UPI0006937C7D|nr:TlpA disulfide reductase family protein [Mobilicoccus massiliensis]